MTVFIPVGYSPILIREDDTKKLKTIIEIPELNIRVPALILNDIKRPQNAFLLFRNEVKDKIKYELIKDNPNIRVDNRQISKIAGEKWKTLTELEKAPYKLKSKNQRMKYKSKNLKYKYKTRKQNLLKSLSVLFQSII
ncbi:high mobility group box domain-containing protein [Gigaspora rosea]|uniref:High mobility group box domain-containing protein n=1 Tax=Gigaspora rosea TaxID=44941 RepID=A0A397W7Y5_9GLOM|nr:high mobility group box domain-containing protein [Gigaspora rosea]